MRLANRDRAVLVVPDRSSIWERRGSGVTAFILHGNGCVCVCGGGCGLVTLSPSLSLSVEEDKGREERRKGFCL